MTETTDKPITFKDRLANARTAYFSVTRALSRGKEGKMLAQVRRAFPHLRIGTYDSEFESLQDWKTNLNGFIADVDCLIVGCDSSRLVGRGVLREINAARASGRLIVLFKLDDNQPRRYWGYEKTGTDQEQIIRLKKREVTVRSRPRAAKN